MPKKKLHQTVIVGRPVYSTRPPLLWIAPSVIGKSGSAGIGLSLGIRQVGLGVSFLYNEVPQFSLRYQYAIIQ